MSTLRGGPREVPTGSDGTADTGTGRRTPAFSCWASGGTGRHTQNDGSNWALAQLQMNRKRQEQRSRSLPGPLTFLVRCLRTGLCRIEEGEGRAAVGSAVPVVAMFARPEHEDQMEDKVDDRDQPQQQEP